VNTGMANPPASGSCSFSERNVNETRSSNLPPLDHVFGWEVRLLVGAQRELWGRRSAVRRSWRWGEPWKKAMIEKGWGEPLSWLEVRLLLRGGKLENDPAMALLVITWIVQGIINSNKTGEILRLQKEIQDLKKTADARR
jgi:hypothetical protein